MPARLSELTSPIRGGNGAGITNATEAIYPAGNYLSAQTSSLQLRSDGAARASLKRMTAALPFPKT
jgi:hypothetical protein